MSQPAQLEIDIQDAFRLSGWKTTNSDFGFFAEMRHPSPWWEDRESSPAKYEVNFESHAVEPKGQANTYVLINGQRYKPESVIANCFKIDQYLNEFSSSMDEYWGQLPENQGQKEHQEIELIGEQLGSGLGGFPLKDEIVRYLRNGDSIFLLGNIGFGKTRTCVRALKELSEKRNPKDSFNSFLVIPSFSPRASDDAWSDSFRYFYSWFARNLPQFNWDEREKLMPILCRHFRTLLFLSLIHISEPTRPY